MTTNGTAETLVYVGGYTQSLPHVKGKASGINVYRLDTATGSLTFVHTLTGPVNPSYLALDPQQRSLYYVEEQTEGRVCGCSIDPATGTLISLNHQPSHGCNPTYVSLDREGRWVFVANYSNGSVAVLPVQEDGGLGLTTDVVQHTGRGMHAERQDGPHAHWIGTDPANRFVLVADLGLDAIVSYRLDAASGKLVRSNGSICTLKPGSGPRHMAFRSDGRFIYVLNELSSTLITCVYDASNGELHPVQRVSTIPAHFAETNEAAAVRVAPSGRFVYASNRGHDSIVTFASDPALGLLSYVGHEATKGRTPRDFNIDPTGTFLLVANQDSDTIVTFRIDVSTGRLRTTGHMTEAKTPTCIAFGSVH